MKLKVHYKLGGDFQVSVPVITMEIPPNPMRQVLQSIAAERFKLFAGNTLIAMARVAFPDQNKIVSTKKLQELASEATDQIWINAGIPSKFWANLRDLHRVRDDSNVDEPG